MQIDSRPPSQISDRSKFSDKSYISHESGQSDKSGGSAESPDGEFTWLFINSFLKNASSCLSTDFQDLNWANYDCFLQTD